MVYVAAVLVLICAISVSGHPLNNGQENFPPKPYVFSYTAGRMPGHVDRVHSESGDGSGIVRGMFSYVDPRQQIRTVEYVADQNGFHPLLITNPTQDTRAVQNAKAKHHVLFNQIAAEHQRVAYERNPNGYSEDEQADIQDASDSFDPNILINHPQDTPVVERAKLRHYDLYNKIALEHAKIAAERGDYDEEQHQPQESHERVVKIGFVKY